MTGPASDTSSTVARPENWDMGMSSRVRPSWSRWAGASIWVPVWEEKDSRVSRIPSRVRVQAGERLGTGVPG